MTSVSGLLAGAHTVQRTIQIDEEGYFISGELRVADPAYGSHLFSHLVIDDRGRFIINDPREGFILVEAFDAPFIAKQILRENGKWIAQMPYGFTREFDLSTLRLDEWDRFHGRTQQGIPFVFSRAAQSEFFNLVDEFDDESVTVDGVQFETSPLLTAKNEDVSSSSYWTKAYTNVAKPGWELEEPNPALVTALPPLKLQPMRVLVLGAGSGNDAAHFASLGHHVTAVDFSDEAIQRAQKKYSSQQNLKFVKADLFALPQEYVGSFDMIFEHTCFCAIDPERRSEMIKVWRRCLTDIGHILAIFFTIDRPNGPPFGATEWELRERMKKGFRPLYWMRLRQQSHPSRQGMETLVYAQKIPFGL